MQRLRIHLGYLPSEWLPETQSPLVKSHLLIIICDFVQNGLQTRRVGYYYLAPPLPKSQQLCDGPLLSQWRLESCSDELLKLSY